MSDLSLEVKAELETDSSACKGLCSRRGAVKIRHIHCPTLWLRHAVARRQIAINRRAGKDLAPDVRVSPFARTRTTTTDRQTRILAGSDRRVLGMRYEASPRARCHRNPHPRGTVARRTVGGSGTL